MKRVLLTGGAGFIGRPVQARLIGRGFEVHALSRQPAPTPGLAQIHWHTGDLLADDISPLLARVRPTHLLHLAWHVEHASFWNSPRNAEWVDASVRLVRAFAEQGGKRIAVAGTCAEYTWGEASLSEDLTPTEPTTEYGKAKLLALRQITEICRRAGLSLGWGRIFSPFGPHEPDKRLIPHLISTMLRGSVAECSAGDQLRDFLFVDDVADALTALLDTPVEGPVNIGSGEPRSVRSVALRVAQLLERPELLKFGTMARRPGDPAALVAQTGRLSREVGWAPRTSFDDGLRKSIAWWAGTLGRTGLATLESMGSA